MGWASFRDKFVKPVVGIALAPYTGGASLAVVGNDLAKREQKKLQNEALAEADRQQRIAITEAERIRKEEMRIATEIAAEQERRESARLSRAPMELFRGTGQKDLSNMSLDTVPPFVLIGGFVFAFFLFLKRG